MVINYCQCFWFDGRKKSDSILSLYFRVKYRKKKSESTEDFVFDEIIKRVLFSFFATILSVSGTRESESLEPLWLCVAWLEKGEESFILERLNDVFFVSPCVLGQKKCKCFIYSESTLSYQASSQALHFLIIAEKQFELNRNMIKNPKWQEATSLLFTKRCRVESGTTRNIS